MLNEKKAVLFEAGEEWDYDVERLNRHNAILMRYCRKLANALEEAKARAVRAEQALALVKQYAPNYYAEVEAQAGANHEV